MLCEHADTCNVAPIVSYTDGVGTFEECENLCLAEADCKSVVYLNATTRTCYLKIAAEEHHLFKPKCDAPDYIWSKKVNDSWFARRRFPS